jgi:Glutaminase
VTTDRVIVDFIAEIRPPVEPPYDKALDANPNGFLCKFRHGDSAWLRPGPKTQAKLRLLESRRQQRLPVFVNVSVDEAITEVRIPVIGKPTDVSARKDGVVRVVLFDSDAVLSLNRETPEFEAALGALLKGQAENRWLIVTATAHQEIINVTAISPEDIPGLRLPKPPNPIEMLFGWLGSLLFRLRHWWRHNSGFWRVVTTWAPRTPSIEEVWDMFALVAGNTCDCAGNPPGCIPFLYPNDGCKARAHEMSRLIAAAGFVPYKLWFAPSGDDMLVTTANSPACVVQWTYHVAVCLDVYVSPSTWITYVIDPALFDGPVTQNTWFQRMNDLSGTVTPRSWIYYSPSATDYDFSTTNGVLTTMRTHLIDVCTASGPPPYGC